MRRVGRPWQALLLIAACAGIAPAAEPKPQPLARYFPKKDLVAYVEFDGVDAHSEAWKKTSLARMFAETPAGPMLEKVAAQTLEGLLSPDMEGILSADDVSKIVSTTARSGFAFAINRKADDPSARPSCIGLVLRGAGKGPLLPTIKKVMTAAGLPAETLEMTKVDKPGGRKAFQIGEEGQPGVAWWVEKNDLVVSILDVKYADAMIAALDGKEPNAIDHPSRLELATTEDGFEPIGLAFLDMTALPKMPPEAADFGLDGIKRMDIRWGYQGEALVSVSRILAPSPRKGVLAMFEQPRFDARSLPPLPAGVGSFTVLSLDLGKVYDQIAALAKLADGDSTKVIAEAEKAFREATGRRLREDVLSQIGPRLVFADVPTQVFISSDRLSFFAQGMARVPRFSLLVEVPDRARFLKDLDAIATWANAQFPIPKDPKAKEGQPASPLFRRLKNGQEGYEVALSPTYWPLPAGYRPSIIVGDRYASIGTSPDVARLALKPDGELGASLDRALASLPGNLTVLTASDTRNSALPEILANVPSMIQWWGFMIQGISVTESVTVSPPRAASGVPVPDEVVASEVGPRVSVAEPVPAEALASPAVGPARPAVPVAPDPAVAPSPVAAWPPQAGPIPPDVPASAPLPPAGVLPAPAFAIVPAPAIAPGVSSVPAPVFPAPASVDPPAMEDQAVRPVVGDSPTRLGPILVRVSPSAVRPAPAQVAGEAPASPFAAIPALKFRLRLDPDEIPTPDELRPYLFAATYAMSVDDRGFKITSRESFPSLNPISLAPLAVTAALPIFQELREESEKKRLSDNLSKVGEALLAYQEKNGHFPLPATLDKDGKPLLSWRVELLPFLGEKDLYDEFERDQPWDSPHNKALLERMPEAFALPDGDDEDGLTHYRGLIGKRAFFDPEVKEGVTIASITDGTSNTLALVETKASVPWTRPGTEIRIEGPGEPDDRTAKLLKRLGSGKGGGFQALLADGSVRFIRDSVDLKVLRAITTRDGEEAVSADSF